MSARVRRGWRRHRRVGDDDDDDAVAPEVHARALRLRPVALFVAAALAVRPEREVAILEVGAGLAWMCRAAKARNAACVTVAQDVSPEAATRCAWVDRYL